MRALMLTLALMCGGCGTTLTVSAVASKAVYLARMACRAIDMLPNPAPVAPSAPAPSPAPDPAPSSGGSQ